ncbi:MAG TPA: sugar phosphate nucleotidyltransferase [Pyrinomonadaceae bacterium]|nr:sugar phosphate nucleotidyltransferase [Pyrinomonadaceae bacterium]
MVETSDNSDLRAVVLAGGDGSRLQRLTRKIDGDWRPKQFSKIFGGKSLLAHTRERLRPICADDQVSFVVIKDHERFYRNELADVDASRIVAQPSNRGTGVAIIAALLQLWKSAPEAIVSFFPSDHYFADDAAFRATVQLAIEVSRMHRDCIVLVGAKPQWPEVEYGWIEPGTSMEDGPGPFLFKVNRFLEKPQLAEARRLMETGGLWNTFVTIGHAKTFLKLLKDTVPYAVHEISNAFRQGGAEIAYRELESIDFSKHVLSQTRRQLLVIRDEVSGWADLGNPRRVIETLLGNRIVPSWLRQMLDVPRLLEEITGVRAAAQVGVATIQAERTTAIV